MTTFPEFATAVYKRFETMSGSELFVAGTGEDDIFAHYLASFPPGSNPLYKTRTEHDCSCCKQFVRNIGRLVVIKGNDVETVWAVAGLTPPYGAVAEAMDSLIRRLAVTSLYRTKERGYGAEVTRQLLEGGAVKAWNHFHGKIAKRHYSTKPEEARGEFNTAAAVFKRGLDELKPEALQDVIDMIHRNSLYRGEEHLQAAMKFQVWQQEYLALADERARSLFVFAHAGDPAVRFRNTVIGTLVQDLSSGVDMEQAVRSFETKVAPTNYKRTTALITPRMVQAAMETIRELGLEPSLERRLATLADVSVNNVLWADRSARAAMRGGVEAMLMRETKTAAPSNTADVSIELFQKEILPSAEAIDLFVSNAHLGNFVTITAPVHADAPQLFRWPNGFAWSYDGNVTDSIRERVKAAGGNVDARLRFSLSWSNYDDLDIHVLTPAGEHVYYHNKCGILDVDMNAGSGTTRKPVENLSFGRPQDGVYRVWVNQYSRRETTDIGFSVEIASDAGISQVSWPKSIPDRHDVLVGDFTVKAGKIIKTVYGGGIVGAGIPQDKWGLRTEALIRVQTVMLSPNHWDGNKVGNRHYFFLLEGCRTDSPARGIYNEFLQPELEKHRKVFEVLGDKTKCAIAADQLSGLGFSSTRGDKVAVSVKSTRATRQFNVQF